jgi:hypothetical protein
MPLVQIVVALPIIVGLYLIVVIPVRVVEVAMWCIEEGSLHPLKVIAGRILHLEVEGDEAWRERRKAGL